MISRRSVYVKVRCCPHRLKEEADRISYKLLLDKERLRIRAQAGGKQGSWKGFNIIDEKRVRIMIINVFYLQYSQCFSIYSRPI